MIRGREPNKKKLQGFNRTPFTQTTEHKVASNEIKDSKLQQLKEEIAVSSYPRQGQAESSEEKVN